MTIRYAKDAIIFGKPKTTSKTTYVGTPKKKYRINIQQRATKDNKIEIMRSFMIYDFKGNTQIEKIKKKLIKMLK